MNVFLRLSTRPSAIDFLAQSLNLQGLVTITNLKTPGATVIDGGNVYGSSFVVGLGTGSLLTMTAIAGVHSIQSNDAAGFRIGSNGSMGLSASGQFGVYIPNSVLDAQRGLRVSGGIADTQVPMIVQSSLNASSLQQGSLPVATTTWVANMNYATQYQLNEGLRQKEIDIVAWVNTNFVRK